jgi:hypothetical protein
MKVGKAELLLNPYNEVLFSTTNNKPIIEEVVDVVDVLKFTCL